MPHGTCCPIPWPWFWAGTAWSYTMYMQPREERRELKKIDRVAPGSLLGVVRAGAGECPIPVTLFPWLVPRATYLCMHVLFISLSG